MLLFIVSERLEKLILENEDEIEKEIEEQELTHSTSAERSLTKFKSCKKTIIADCICNTSKEIKWKEGHISVPSSFFLLYLVDS